MDFKHQDITNLVIKAFYNVYNILGYGFLERVYERSMMIELRSLGLICERPKLLKVNYKGFNVGEYFADIIVETKVIIELKAAESLVEEHSAQLLNYLRATEIEVGLLLNFGKEPKFKRLIFDNQFKSPLRSVPSV